MFVEVPNRPDDYCLAQYGAQLYVPDLMICAGEPEGKAEKNSANKGLLFDHTLVNSILQYKKTALSERFYGIYSIPQMDWRLISLIE